MSREYEIIKRKLTCEINQNIDKIKVLRAKRNIVHCNRLDSKIISFMGLSFFIGVVILLLEICSIGYLNNFMIPYRMLPYLSLGISGISGILLEKILVNKLKFKSNLEKFSRSKTEIEKITEELNYRLEEEKLLNYNKALEKVMSDKALSDKLSGQDKYEKVDTRTNMQILSHSQKLNLKLEAKLKKLDIISKRFVLKDVFRMVRDRDEKLLCVVGSAIFFGIVPFVMFNMVQILLLRYITSFSIDVLDILMPLFVGSVIGTCYGLKKVSNYKKVFQKVNQALEKKAISEKVDDNLEQFYNEDLIYAISEVCVLRLQLEKENINLENKMLEQDSKSKEELLFSYEFECGMERKENRGLNKELSFSDEGNSLVRKKVKREDNNK